MAKKKATPSKRRSATVTSPEAAGPELIVIMQSEEEAPPPAAGRARAQSRARGESAVSRVMRRAGATLQPLFGVTAERVAAERETLSRRGGVDVPRLERFYRVEAPRGSLR